MSSSVPAETAAQLSRACDVIQNHLASTLLAVHWYGSALDGGLKPYSDVDLLVTVSARPDEAVRRALLLDLLDASAPPGQSDTLRALEVTVLVRGDIVPWRYPAWRELQFGEWLRRDILAGIIEPAVVDADLAILLAEATATWHRLGRSIGGAAFRSGPLTAISPRRWSILSSCGTHPRDWMGDERNVVLALARIWYTAATGRIVPKDVASSRSFDPDPLHDSAQVLRVTTIIP